jgi:hypothetical protein
MVRSPESAVFEVSTDWRSAEDRNRAVDAVRRIPINHPSSPNHPDNHIKLFLVPYTTSTLQNVGQMSRFDGSSDPATWLIRETRAIE